MRSSFYFHHNFWQILCQSPYTRGHPILLSNTHEMFGVADRSRVNYDNTIRAGRIIFLRWQISCRRKKERVARTNTRLWKAEREARRRNRTQEEKRVTGAGPSKAPERIRQPGGSTENDDRPLFPPSGLNYYHPAEHCLLWRRIILLSLGRPASNALRWGPLGRRTREKRWEAERGGADWKEGARERRNVQQPRFRDLLIFTRANRRVVAAKNRRSDSRQFAENTDILQRFFNNVYEIWQSSIYSGKLPKIADNRYDKRKRYDEKNLVINTTSVLAIYFFYVLFIPDKLKRKNKRECYCRLQNYTLYLKKVFPREMKGYLVILYFAEIYRTLCFKTTKENTIIYQKKSRTFTFENKWPVFFEPYEKYGKREGKKEGRRGNEREWENERERRGEKYRAPCRVFNYARRFYDSWDDL